uniref:Cyclic nucleotide-binding domain-containing protein n=1 Tax=Desulfobacca acetoxidans TaxID=60893 RepID=A0A7V4LCX3_9BACT
MISHNQLKKIFIFQDLDAKELDQVIALGTLHHFAAGQVIIAEGDAGECMYVMCEGEVEVTKRLTMILDKDTPRERMMVRLRSADGVSFGEMALLENEVRSATVTALSDCVLLELKRDDLLDYIRQNSSTGCKILLRLAQLLSRYLRKTNQDVVKLTTALAIALGG